MLENMGDKMEERKRDSLIKELKSMSDNPRFFANPGEDFDGDINRIIWTGAEESWIDGEPLANYYGSYARTGKGHPKFEEWLTKNGLWWEWYDTATIMIYEDNF